MDEAKNQINDLEHKEPKNNQSEQEEKRIQKNEDSIWNLWDNFKRFNIHFIRVPEGEEKQQEIGKLSEKIVKETFPTLVKEIGMKVQEAQRVPNNMNPKRPTPRHIIIKVLKVKDIENLKSSKRKAVSCLQGSFYKTVSWFLNWNLEDQKVLARNIQSDEKQVPIAKIILPSKTIIENWRRESCQDKKKPKEFIITKPVLLKETLKGLL